MTSVLANKIAVSGANFTAFLACRSLPASSSQLPAALCLPLSCLLGQLSQTPFIAMHRTLSTRASQLSSSPAPTPVLAAGLEIILERGCSWGKIGSTVAGHGSTCLAVVGDSTRAVDQAQRSLFEIRKGGTNCVVFTARGAYPTAEGIDDARAMARRVGATSIVGIGVGGAIDTAKGAAKLHTTSGKCASFLKSPGSVMISEGNHKEPLAPTGEGLPLVMVPSAAGAGPCANDRCLVWHPEDEVLVPMAAARGKQKSASVALVDAESCSILSREMTVAMALTAVSACLDALLAVELGGKGSVAEEKASMLLELGTRGITAIGTGLPIVLAKKDIRARELLTLASVCAGQLSAITPAPATQVLARAAGSLLCRHSYPSVCATVFPHVVADMVEQTNSFSADAEVSEAINRALSKGATALRGEQSDAEALVSWLDDLQQQKLLASASLSDLDSMVEAKEVATNMEMLLAVEEDTEAADRLFSGSGVLAVAERAIG